jgi:hypothetical protein
MLHVTTESPGLVGKKGARKGLLLEDESASHDDLVNLSILLTRGKEINKDTISNSE